MSCNNVSPKKRLGQHFLTNQEVAQRIVEAVQSQNRNVLEIGPGTGALTQYLIRKENINYKMVEIDEESVLYLEQHFPSLAPNIISADFLQLDLQKLYSEPLTIIGNFPYNISSQILFKLLDNRDLVTELVGMFQKEVAERVAAPPGKRQNGILSILLQAFYDIEYLFTVDENQFYPPPKVKSGVIRVTRNFEKQLHCSEQLFKRVVKTAFNQRRKTLRNSLKSFRFEESYLSDAIFGLRPEQIGVEEFEEICLHICDN